MALRTRYPEPTTQKHIEISGPLHPK